MPGGLAALLVGLPAAAQEPAQPATGELAPPAAETGSALVVDWRALYVHLRGLHDATGSTVLVAPVGDAARATARRAAGLFSPGEVELRALPTAGDRQAEIDLALAATGLPCAAVVSPEGGNWRVDTVGDCRRQHSAEAADLGPPHLAIGSLGGDPGWRVRTEAGEPVDAWRYAALTRDDDLRDRLVTERRRHRVGRTVLTAAGAALVAGALVPLTASVFAEDEIAEDRRFSALFLSLSGGTLVLGARLDRRGLDARQEDVARYVHPVDAAAVIADHNARLDRAAAQQAAQQAAQPASPEPAPPPEPAPAEPPVEP